MFNKVREKGMDVRGGVLESGKEGDQQRRLIIGGPQTSSTRRGQEPADMRAESSKVLVRPASKVAGTVEVWARARV
mgnify:FL=1